MSEYPKMLFREATGAEPMIRCESYNLDYLTVDNEGDELAASEEGWRVSPDPRDHDRDGRKGGRRNDPRDDEIAGLKAQLAALQPPRRGRPPKVDVEKAKEAAPVE